jgi:hypothetical protein
VTKNEKKKVHNKIVESQKEKGNGNIQMKNTNSDEKNNRCKL